MIFSRKSAYTQDKTILSASQAGSGSPSGQLSFRKAFWILQAAFILMLIAVEAIIGKDNGRLLYLWMLFTLSTSSLLLTSHLNDRYVIANIFFPILFIYYGLADLLYLFGLPLPVSGLTYSSFTLSPGESGVIVGMVSLIFGFKVSQGFYKKKIKKEKLCWNTKITLGIGFAFWIAGILGVIIAQFTIADRAVGDLEGTSPVLLVILRMLGPFGAAMVFYDYIVNRRKKVLLIIIVLILAEFFVGFITDSKEVSFKSLAIFVISRILIEGRVPFKLISVAVCVALLSFSIFLAYRIDVLQEASQTRQKAFESFSQNLDKAVQSNSGTDNQYGGQYYLIVRTYLKPIMEMVVSETGNKVHYQNGDTIFILFHAFIPRYFWPDKPDSSVGRVFNREFKVSEDPDTYISATHLAELYWNFGWAGVIIGMFVIGLFLSSVSSRCNLRETRSNYHYLVLVAVIYLVCIRFEGGIALQYTLLFRSLIILWILNLFMRKFAR